MRAIAWMCLMSLAGSTPGATETPSDRDAALAGARGVVEAARYATLATVGLDGHPQARIVDPFAPEDDWSVWIATRPVTRKVAQIRADPRVSLVYFAEGEQGYVNLVGTAELVDDPAEKARHWKPEWSPFYSDDNRGEDYLLIRVRPLRLEIVAPARELVGDPDTWLPLLVGFETHQ